MPRECPHLAALTFPLRRNLLPSTAHPVPPLTNLDFSLPADEDDDHEDDDGNDQDDDKDGYDTYTSICMYTYVRGPARITRSENLRKLISPTAPTPCAE